MKYTKPSKDFSEKEITALLIKMQKIRINEWSRCKSSVSDHFGYGWEKGVYDANGKRVYMTVDIDGTVNVNQLFICNCKELRGDLLNRYHKQMRRKEASERRDAKARHSENVEAIKGLI
jgi:hypothetical protein